MCDEYYGWPNKPTWSIFVWLSSHLYVERHARAIAGWGTEAFKTFVEGYLLLDEKNGLEMELLNWVLAQVDWDRLVEAFKE